MLEEESGQTDSFIASPWYAGDNAWHPPHWLKYDSSLMMKYAQTLPSKTPLVPCVACSPSNFLWCHM